MNKKKYSHTECKHNNCCACEHDEHSNACACGHEHDEHSDSCACGHEHVHSEKDSPILLFISIGLFALGLIFEHLLNLPEFISAILFGVATVISGYKVFLSGIKSLIKFKFNENVLMSIAIITAFVLGEFGEASAVAILFCLGEIAEGIAEKNSRKSIEALTEIRPDSARILTENGETITSPQNVKIGDLVVVNPFERIPVDGIVTVGNSYVDNSALTGESIPINIGVGDNIISGAVNGSSKITVKTTSEFADSTSSRILKLIEDSSAKKGSAEKLITRFAKIYTPIVLIIAILVTFIPPLVGLGSIQVWLYRALVMLVASCPCALVISVPLGFFAGIGAQSKIGVLIKGGKYLEALSKTDAIAFDKTGTITTSKLKISKIVSSGSLSEKELLDIAAAVEALSTHPVARAICNEAVRFDEAESISESPGKGITATLDGKNIIVGRRLFLEEHNITINSMENMTVYIAVNGTLVGGIELSDTIKPDSPAAIAELRNMKISSIVMLTGDNMHSAREVAQACNITEYHASLLPADKADFVSHIQGKSIVFVGDGVNDAPVLAAADCGIAMGLGSQAAIETADVVLSAGNLSALPKAIRLSKKAMGIIHFNIIFALSFKVLILILAALGYAPMWLGIISDVGVMLLTVLNAMRLTGKKQ